MFKLLILFSLISVSAVSQETNLVSTYKNGQNGMELIISSKKQTVIVSTFNSKMSIKEDIAQKVYNLYKENKLKTGETVCVNGNEAKVTGDCFITKKGDLIAVNFYYNKIEWSSGLVELHKDRL